MLQIVLIDSYRHSTLLCPSYGPEMLQIERFDTFNLGSLGPESLLSELQPRAYRNGPWTLSREVASRRDVQIDSD